MTYSPHALCPARSWRALPLLALLLSLPFHALGCDGGEAQSDGGVVQDDAGSPPDDAAPPTDGGAPGCNVVVIEDDITTPTTWSGDRVYLIKHYDFYVYATLVIEPGAIIKFHPSDGPDLNLGGGGVIMAQGTATQPIIFTSFRDDDHGCDLNEDGDATSPARRDWGGINLNGENGSVFDYCEFYYGGDTAYTTTLTFSAGSQGTVTNCLFAHNDGSDSSGWYGALDASDAIAGTVIQGNIFYDNIRPLSVRTTFDVDDSNVFHNPGDDSSTNTYNGIFVESIDHIAGPITWLETEVAFVIDDNDFWIESGGSLTLGDNVVLKFRPDSEIVLAAGASNLPNHGGTGVYFTSYRDDTLKGDTNGDGSTTSPADGDWGGIYDDTAPSEPYYFSWSNILYDSH